MKFLQVNFGTLGRHIRMALLVTPILLSGCGGGGSGGGGNSGGFVGISGAPVASPSVLQVTEDEPASSALTATDSNQEPLTFSIVSNGSLGTAVITNAATGAYTYTPNPNANGTDSFSFKVNDGSTDSNTASVTVEIAPVQDAPTAQAGNLDVTEDTAAHGALNASDADADPLTYSIVSNGTQGTAVITDPATGAFTYTPNPNANGVDIFTFQVNDGTTDSNPAAITVTIAAVNDPPVATGTCGTTPQAQTLAGTLTATDPESPSLLVYSLADGSSGPFTTAKGGEVTITDPTTGAFTYTPRSLAAHGERGTDTFGFRVTDPDGAVSTATQTVVVDQTIMPLGDSITQGGTSGSLPPVETRVGYRKTLYDSLRSDGASIDLVGSLVHGDAVPDFDYNHEGHGGWTASEIAWGRAGGYPTDGVRAWLDLNPADFVLLHIGTNGFDVNNDIDVEAILDEIDLWEASTNGYPVTVLLALIIDWNPLNPDVPVFNSNVLAMANARIANGDDIVIVNQHDALTYPDDMIDTLHPTQGGYNKMGTTWFNTLTNLVDKCP